MKRAEHGKICFWAIYFPVNCLVLFFGYFSNELVVLSIYLSELFICEAIISVSHMLQIPPQLFFEILFHVKCEMWCSLFLYGFKRTFISEWGGKRVMAGKYHGGVCVRDLIWGLGQPLWVGRWVWAVNGGAVGGRQHPGQGLSRTRACISVGPKARKGRMCPPCGACDKTSTFFSLGTNEICSQTNEPRRWQLGPLGSESCWPRWGFRIGLSWKVTGLHVFSLDGDP